MITIYTIYTIYHTTPYIIDQIVRLLALLQITDQIPPEKQVIETNVKYPVKIYTRKTPSDMILQYRKHIITQKKLKDIIDPSTLSIVSYILYMM